VRLLVDADVVIGALDSSDAHHQHARALFIGARERQDSILIGVVNLSEVLIAPAADAARLAAAREAIAALGITIHQPSEAIAVDAARLRGRHPISLPDAYLLAGAKHAGATLASFDRKVQQAAKLEGLATV
jgi:predicted nucleic acid-binding protein